MKFRRTYLIPIVLLPVAGCSAYQLEPLKTNHPAHPEAVAATKQPVSKTLAYTQADIPSTQPVSAVAAAEEGGKGGAAPRQQTVVGEGRVVATVPTSSQIVVEHGEIKDFMEPMTMGYRVNPPSLTEGLKAGDKVRFTIEVPIKTIVKIEKLQ